MTQSEIELRIRALEQPGLRYAPVDALIGSLLLDETFGELSLPERMAVQE